MTFDLKPNISQLAPVDRHLPTLVHEPCFVIATRGDQAEAAKAPQAGFARSKLKAMDPEIARNQDYDDHDANDGKDVHSVPLHSMMMARCGLARRVSATSSIVLPP